MMVTVRALPTPYDPPAGTLTVATPSCCCSSCCCCCLNTLSAAAGVTAGVAHRAATDNGRPAVAAALLGVVAVLAAVGAAWLVARGQSQDAVGPPLGAAIAVYVVVALAAFRHARTHVRGALPVALGVGALTPVLVFVEIALALATELWIEVAAPLCLWGGWRLGRTLLRDRAGTPE